MDELLHRWSDRMLVDVAEPLPDAVLESGSLLRPPAPDSVIDQAEARLGVNLPASYRSFLSISDGAHADFEVVPASEPRSDSSDPTFGLVPASELSMLSDVLPDVVESLAQIPELEAEGLRDAILVSSLTWERGKYFLCLTPAEIGIGDGGERFGLWDKGHSEIDRYASFGDWLRKSVTDHWYDPGEVFLDVNRHLAVAEVAHSEHWNVSHFVCQIRRLTAVGPTAATLAYLHELWTHPESIVRLAASQVLARLQPDVGFTWLNELKSSADPTVALVAECSERVLGS